MQSIKKTKNRYSLSQNLLIPGLTSIRRTCDWALMISDYRACNCQWDIYEKRWQFYFLHVDKISISMRNIVCVCCPPRGNLAWTPFWNYKHILLYVCRHVSVLSHSWFILGFFHNFFFHILNTYRICITESNCTIYWVCELYVCIRQTFNLKKHTDSETLYSF